MRRVRAGVDAEALDGGSAYGAMLVVRASHPTRDVSHGALCTQLDFAGLASRSMVIP